MTPQKSTQRPIQPPAASRRLALRPQPWQRAHTGPRKSYRPVQSLRPSLKLARREAFKQTSLALAMVGAMLLAGWVEAATPGNNAVVDGVQQIVQNR